MNGRKAGCIAEPIQLPGTARVGLAHLRDGVDTLITRYKARPRLGEGAVAKGEGRSWLGGGPSRVPAGIKT